MRTSKFYFFKNIRSTNLVEKIGLNIKVSNGFYFYSSLGCFIIEKIIKIIEKELIKNNIYKVIVPLLQSEKNFYKLKKDRFKNEIYKIKDNDFILNPTCEEIFIKIYDKRIYKDKIKDITFFNTSSKFRKEKRTCNLTKTREFIMTDLYSFCNNIKVSNNNYKKIIKLFEKILNFFKIKFKKIIKREENIRSVHSTEFVDLNNFEIAHCFMLNKCYMTYNYVNCFGIGISRLYNLIVLKCFNKKKKILKILKLNFVLIPTDFNNIKLMKYTKFIYKNKKFCLFDDRKINFKVKILNFENFFINIIILSNFCLRNKKVTFLKKGKKVDIDLKYFLKYFN